MVTKYVVTRDSDAGRWYWTGESWSLFSDDAAVYANDGMAYVVAADADEGQGVVRRFAVVNGSYRGTCVV